MPVLTESWPLDHDPRWPPHWDAGTATAEPLIVYLDQWCFDHLARDRAGRALEPSEAGTFELLRGLALDGSVVFPLSQAHYRENWKRDNVDARWDTAVVMGELSGFHTLRMSNLQHWDALVGAGAFLDAAVRIDKPAVVGWGLKHCLTGNQGEAFILDTSTGARAQWDSSLPEDMRGSLEALEAAVPYRFELAMLALRDPRMESALMPLVSIADTQGRRFADQERSIRAAIERHGRTAQVVRNTIEFLAFKDSLALFDPALRYLGYEPNTIVEAIVADVTDGQSSAMNRLLQAMPIQGAFTELRVQSHLKAQWNTTDSDLLDFLALATALPFVDYYVSDRKTYNLAASADLGRRGGGRVLRSLRSLCDLLQARI
jgi:hypothetical protein